MADSTRRSGSRSGTPAPGNGSTPEDSTSDDRRRRDRRPLTGAGARPAPVFLLTTPAVPADEVAEIALRVRLEREAAEAPRLCDACDAPIEGEPAGSGLYLWSRGGEEPRIEEPPLCEACATAIGVTALRSWDTEEEEEG